MLKFLRISLSILLFSSLFVETSCTYNKKEVIEPEVDVCDTLSYSFQAVVLPIINNNCGVVGCHNSGSGFGALTNFNEVDQYVQSGRLETKLFSATANMPLGKDWTSNEDKQKVKCWLENGAKND